jgi:hypothetical protein
MRSQPLSQRIDKELSKEARRPAPVKRRKKQAGRRKEAVFIIRMNRRGGFKALLYRIDNAMRLNLHGCKFYAYQQAALWQYIY